MKLVRLSLAALVAGGITSMLASPRLALAQASDPAAADALFQKGREAAEKGDWAVACPKFSESQRLDPAPGTLLNLADCEEHLGNLANAYEHFKTAVETMTANDDRIPFAKQHMAALEKKVPHLTLNATADLPANAKVTRDDVQLGSASYGLALPVDPGTHTILVAAPGHADRRVTVTLKVGDTLAVALTAGDVETSGRVPSALPATSSAPEVASSSSTDPKRTLGIALVALGGAGLAVGAVTGVLVLGKKSTVEDPAHCDQITHACDQTGIDAASDGKTFSTVSTVAFAAGSAALAAGIVLFIVGGHSSSSAATAIAPSGYPGGAGLRVIHTF